ncbi:MAG: DUF3221 domain-containing protein [Mahellales bacterium]|jgi:hypothetical protein
MIRPRVLIICLMLIAIILAGCANQGKDEGYSFSATVLENDHTSLLVQPDEGSDELRSADKIFVSVKDADLVDARDTEITMDDIKVGARVEVFYNGAIAESYPAQLQGCFKVKLLD